MLSKTDTSVFRKLSTKKYKGWVAYYVLATDMNQSTIKPKNISLPTLVVTRYFWITQAHYTQSSQGNTLGEKAMMLQIG